MDILQKMTNMVDKHKAGIYFSSEADCIYLSKFSSTNAHIFYIDKQWFYLTDERYLNAAKKVLQNFTVLDLNKEPLTKVIIPLLTAKQMNLYIDINNLNLAKYLIFSRLFTEQNQIKLLPRSFLKLRSVKDSVELETIKQALIITEEIWEKFQKKIVKGVSEKELKNLLMILIFSTKADGISFEPIIAAGKNGANPHWNSSDYRIQIGDLVTIDFGIKYNQYCSDFTRTVLVGKKATAEQKFVYDLVYQGLDIAFNLIKPGVKAKRIDLAVRNFFIENNYGDYFLHSLGHSFGLEIHESPNFSTTDETILQKGMVLTVEPGLYLANKFGVRIEQSIVITENGCQLLNTAPIIKI